MRKLALLFLCALPLCAQPTKTIVAAGLTPADVEALQQAAPAGVKVVGANPANMTAQLAEAEGLIGAPTPEQLRAAPKLRWVQTHSAGVDDVLHPDLIKSSVTVTNVKILMGPNIADHAFAMLLALTRDIPRALNGQRRQEWTRTGYRPVELDGRTAVIIGVGGIGMQIAQRARGFGMKTIGVDPGDIPMTPLLDFVVPPDRLDSVLPSADVVFIAAPLTQASRGMMGAKQFGLLREGTYFIAVSRGRVYETAALVTALDSGRLAGAGLDVTDPEPLPSDHALWKFPNVVITPHVSGISDKMPIRRLELFKENIRRFAAGAPLLNVVDKQKGY